MGNKSVLFGVCGIGRGHIYESLPFIEEFMSRGYKIAVLAFGDSYDYFKFQYTSNEHFEVFKVDVPWIHTNSTGIDFKRTAEESINKSIGYFTTNFESLHEVQEFLGIPNIVISNYEPVSAVIAYSLDVPLVTLDQQSKYLLNSFPDISNYSSKADFSRLNLFFPKANLRIVNSFFKFSDDRTEMSRQKIVYYGPIIRDQITALEWSNVTEDSNLALVYLSSFSHYPFTNDELVLVLKEFSNYSFVIFANNKNAYSNSISKANARNITVQRIGDENFYEILSKCCAVLSTAGHTFLSELMYLHKPVLVIPNDRYEQHYNASIIDKHNFGKSVSNINTEALRCFFENLSKYKTNIIENKDSILFKKRGNEEIIQAIDQIIR